MIDELDDGRRRPPRAVPRGRRADAAHPLQGDAPPPPARAARAASPTASAPSASCSRRCASAPTSCIDTTGLSAAALRRKVADELLEPATPGRLAVTFTSFGHKHGPPRDADLAFDVRFLPNPHYEPDLRPLTGLDQRIVDYVDRDGRLEEFYDHVLPLLDYLLPAVRGRGQGAPVVAIGCTGGRHRSVAIAEHLARALPRPRRSTSSRSRTATSTRPSPAARCTRASAAPRARR